MSYQMIQYNPSVLAQDGDVFIPINSPVSLNDSLEAKVYFTNDLAHKYQFTQTGFVFNQAKWSGGTSLGMVNELMRCYSKYKGEIAIFRRSDDFGFINIEYVGDYVAGKNPRIKKNKFYSEVLPIP